MQIIRNLHNIEAHFLGGCVVTIGNYDGMHLGHQQLLAILQERARILKLPAVIIMFEPHPEEFFSGKRTLRLTSIREKIALLTHYTIDYVLLLSFNQRLAKCSAQQFVYDVLLNKLHTKHLVIGDDFVFGVKREAGYSLLLQEGKKYGFQVTQVATFKIDERRVSSTLLREVLLDGKLQFAKSLLGRAYRVCGRVVRGSGLGSTLGFSTANIYLEWREMPLSGVYLVKVYNLKLPFVWGIANIGFRPTVSKTKRRKLLEVHLLDFTGNVYGKRLEVEFCSKRRDEQKFNSLEELRLQLMKDVAWAKSQSGGTVKSP